MILKKLSYLSRTKKIVGLSAIVATLIVSACVLQEICKPKLYKKLQGTCNILLEETYINRSTEFKPLSFTLTFENSDVELPTIRSANDNAARNYEGIKELERNAKGKWKVIGEKEDSILIDAPKNILNGKYAVCLQKVEYFHDNIYILWLENDSTRLCYSKAVSPKAEIEWE